MKQPKNSFLLIYDKDGKKYSKGFFSRGLTDELIELKLKALTRAGFRTYILHK